MPGLLNDYTAVHKVNGLRYFILEANTNSVVWSLKWIVLPPRYWEQGGGALFGKHIVIYSNITIPHI